MIYFSDNDIDRLIKEDMPYIDLTTELLGIGRGLGKIEFKVREDAIVSCTEEVERIFFKLGIDCTHLTPSGVIAPVGTLIVAGEGEVASLHTAWKVCLNLLEYAIGISTFANNLNKAAKASNPDISVFFTRKSFPGTKQFVVKAAMSGGIYPHRLGVSETILVFENHLRFVGGYNGFMNILPDIKKKAVEKKIIVEVERYEDAEKLVLGGVDGVQFDKVHPKELIGYVNKLKDIKSDITIIAAGGVNHQNIKEYSETGVDAIATSCIFHAKPLDISAKILGVK